MGLIFDVKRFAIHDGPGIRTTVFMKGCPLRCPWCHNPESLSVLREPAWQSARCGGCGACVEACGEDGVALSEGTVSTDVGLCTLCGTCVEACVAGARTLVGRCVGVDELMLEIERDVVFYDQSGGGVTFSGGEPLVQAAFLCDVLAQCKAWEIHTAVDTSCYAERGVLEQVADVTDLFLCDVKHIDSARHEEFTGVGNEGIFENLRWLASTGRDMVIRVPIIPGFNDDEACIEGIAHFVRSLGTVTRIDVLPYHTAGVGKAGRLAAAREPVDMPPPDDAGTIRAMTLFREHGFTVRKGG